MATIHIQNLQVYGHHGCFHAEQVVGTHFSVDVWLEYDALKAAQQDDLHQAVDYAAVCKLIIREMRTPAHLVEHLALRIKTAIHTDYPQVQSAKVRVSKLNPPIGCELECVSVEL